MLEVMIAILTIAAFLTGTLQLMAFTALYKVRSERQAQANFWIQEDFEDVKYLASTLDNSSSYVSPDVCTNISQGYATALRRQLTATLPPTTPIPTEQLVGTRPFVRKNYSLYRTFNITNQSANPHRLRIDYRVQLATGQTADDYRNQENVIAKSSVEVIPDASFKCP
ncbi:MAG: type 4 pilin [Microcystis panniformis Mp_MB_F_20051200_S9]|uniref:Type 4 pilin n=1 Tax=Microcystis panniformis Mp_MB_F_20051200_S9 TaxID=2486223 RepID=A0A552PY50_9CHRO|nr:MAG: type 4 pilin [Microcystis panniformis Mp_GB_SS_20050300_S99]TRV45298.1 MAG: type 4 pilin [Microcystis panniformis Mp_GB_SS_20050300_S99D]TRV51069.1 MAG: type 4 pilin [Microcystis panniformis Mp_MB_F_20080800_S26D]TRV60522.1 MAG: type 4 pilin [Microcystis panniformis Mp_MB_F_20080800_S26]TRV61869.1 MAG: type 4 pilin [Microcystis panniformis Mp_MB_F_20051200_S9]TRV63441.1 MAG: type 4 pilin [Microcystis panniformis Mp_MB_F_20051200_S9D]TRV69595.1 MAG: type 4 pilin [Microcystis panniformi